VSASMPRLGPAPPKLLALTLSSGSPTEGVVAALLSPRQRTILWRLLWPLWRIFAPDVFLRQFAALCLVILARRLLWYARRWVRAAVSRVLCQVSPTARRASELRSARRSCPDYASWKSLGEELDTVQGLDRWKKDDRSPLFDAVRLRERTKKYRDLMASRDVEGCMFALRGELLRKHFGICNPALFEVCATGTKALVEEYVATVCEAMTWVALPPTSLEQVAPGQGGDALPSDAKAALAEKLAFFTEIKQSFGRSALLLSGGASIGMYHFGVVKALHLNGLLPRVISGTSAGSIVSGMLGARTDEELMEMWAEDFQWEKHFNLNFFAGKDWGRFKRRRGEALYDADHLGEVLRSNIGEYTFLEAFDRTGRICNITVSGLPGNTKYPMLLNYLTSPHVIIWSAAVASAAVPGIFESRELLARDRHGNTVPYVSGGLKWRDGSMQNDLPMARLSELFNVNYFIVSQVNPHARLLTGGGCGSLRGPVYRTAQFLRREVKQYLLSMSELWMGTAGRRVEPWLRPVGHSVVGIVAQEYEGDVTIYNGRGMLEIPDMLTNGSEEMIRRYTAISERQTWWDIPQIENACAIEFVMDEVMKELRRRLVDEVEEAEGVQEPASSRRPSRCPSLIERILPEDSDLKRESSLSSLRQRKYSTSSCNSIGFPEESSRSAPTTMRGTQSCPLVAAIGRPAKGGPAAFGAQPGIERTCSSGSMLGLGMKRRASVNGISSSRSFVDLLSTC